MGQSEVAAFGVVVGVTRTEISICLASILGASALSGGAAADMPAPGRIEAAGAVFPFVEAGTGAPVLFVHGATSDFRAWAGVWDDAARVHRAIAYTQRWFGAGDWPGDKPFSRDVHTSDLVALLEAWGEPMNVVAWSYGGPIALRAAARAPELVRSLVLYEPTLSEILSGTPERKAAREARRALWAETEAALRARDYEEAAREAIEAVFGLDEGGFATLDSASQAMFLENAYTLPMDWNAPSGGPLLCGELETIAAPTLLIVGGATVGGWDLMAEAIADCMPNAAIAVIEGVGHGGPIQASAEFAKLTLEFIDAQ